MVQPIIFFVITLSEMVANTAMTIIFSGQNVLHTFYARVLSDYSDLTLSQEFQPMTAQLSMKAALPLAKILATAS